MNDNNTEKMGFWTVVLMGINTVLGSAVFLLPSSGMKTFGPASILVLILDAVLALFIYMCFAECAGMFTETGGAYIYAKYAFGNFWGYEIGFISWASKIIATATMYVGFATALGGTFPELNTPFAKNVVVTVLAVGLMLMNLSGVKTTSILNNIITFAKLIPILLVALIGVFFINPGNFTPFFVKSLTTPTNFFATAMTMFLIFAGAEEIAVAAEDMKDVKKNLPRALILSLGIVAIIYILVMVACVGILGGNLVNSTVPLQDAMTHVWGKLGGAIIAAGTFISIGGICLAFAFVTPRSGQALAENKMMPAALAKKNKKNAPYVAIIVSTVLSLLISYSGTFNILAQIDTISCFAQYVPTILAVIVLRKTMPNHKRTFKIPGGWTIPIIALILCILLLANADKMNLVWGLGSFIIAIPFFFITRQKQIQ